MSGNLLVIDSKAFANIYTSSPEGIIEDICNKFESSRSVEELVILSRGKRYARRLMINVMKKEQHLQRSRANKFHGRKPRRPIKIYDDSPIFKCLSQWADHIREYNWGKKIIGVTMPPLQTPNKNIHTIAISCR